MLSINRFIQYILVTAFILSSSAFAGGDDPETGFRVYPFLQQLTTDSVGISFETHNSDSATLKVSVNSDMSNYVTHQISSGKIRKMTLSGLSTNTRYYYTVTSDGATSPVGSFVTALPKGSRLPFRFAVYGDTREAAWYEDIVAAYGDNDDHLPVCQSMASKAPDFVLHVGDFALDGTDMDDVINFFDVEKDLLRNHPLVPTYGNHEFSGGSGTGNTYFDSYFMSSGNSGDFAYYSYNYGNVHVLVINTGVHIDNNDSYDLLLPGTPQYNFIQSDLQNAAADSDIDHIFVSLHVPVHSASSWGDNPTLVNTLRPLFEQNGVKVVFEGHDHDYQHLEKNGIHYILSGGGGSPILKMGDISSDATIHKYEDVLNYVIVDVNDTSLVLETYKVQGQGNSSSSLLERIIL